MSLTFSSRAATSVSTSFKSALRFTIWPRGVLIIPQGGTEPGDGGGERGHAVGGDAASGCPGFADGGCAEVANGSGLVHQLLRAQFHDLALGQVHFAVTIQVAGFFEVNGEGAGENKCGVFERGFGCGFGIGSAAGRGIGLRGFGGDCAVVGRKLHDVRAEVGGRFAVPRGFVIGALGDIDARAHHVELDLKAVVHGRKVFNAREAAKGKMKGFCAETGAKCEPHGPSAAAGSGRTAAAALRRA